MISIIVPVYNVKLYLDECVDSILAQDYKDFEIIIVDDGSTDGSSEVCDKQKEKDSRIKVVHQKNGGLSAARNTGLKHAKGDFISFIDSDDMVSPSMYTDLIDALEINKADVAICNFEVFNKENRYKCGRYKNQVIDYSPSNQTRFYSPALDSSCNRLFRAEPIRKHSLMFEPKTKVAQEDFWFLVRLFTHISRIVTINECHYKYRERGSSITKSHSDGDITKRCLDFIMLTKTYIYTYSKREYSDFINYTYVDMFMASINNASNIKVYAIKEIVQQYMKEPQFFIAISKYNLKNVLLGTGLKHHYDMLCFGLLRCGLINVYSLLESLRLKRLRSSGRRNLYFE